MIFQYCVDLFMSKLISSNGKTRLYAFINSRFANVSVYGFVRNLGYVNLINDSFLTSFNTILKLDIKNNSFLCAFSFSSVGNQNRRTAQCDFPVGDKSCN